MCAFFCSINVILITVNKSDYRLSYVANSCQSFLAMSLSCSVFTGNVNNWRIWTTSSIIGRVVYSYCRIWQGLEPSSPITTLTDILIDDVKPSPALERILSDESFAFTKHLSSVSGKHNHWTHLFDGSDSTSDSASQLIVKHLTSWIRCSGAGIEQITYTDNQHVTEMNQMHQKSKSFKKVKLLISLQLGVGLGQVPAKIFPLHLRYFNQTIFILYCPVLCDRVKLCVVPSRICLNREQ